MRLRIDALATANRLAERRADYRTGTPGPAVDVRGPAGAVAAERWRLFAQQLPRLADAVDAGGTEAVVAWAALIAFFRREVAAA